MNKYLSTLFMFFVVSTDIFSQSVENIRAEYETSNTNILVYYDFLLPSHNKNNYKIELFYSLDSGKTFSEPLQFVSGEVGNNIPTGRNKKIIWNFFVEFPDFDGEHIMFRVRARIDRDFEERQILALGTTREFWRSAVFPGWGDNHVRIKNNYWWVGGLSYGVLGTGIFYRLKAENTFDNYTHASSVENADKLFNQALNQKKLGDYLLMAGGAIWLTDVILVALKGARNQRKQNEIKTRYEQTGFQFQLNPHRMSITYKF